MAKVNTTHCKQQIMRLSATSFFPQAIEGIAELVGTLQRNSKSDEHASRVITAALEASANCPTPHDLIQLCRQIGAEVTEYPGACQLCAPMGGDWRLRQTPRGEGLDRCTCARGRALAAKDAARKGAAEAKAKPVEPMKRLADAGMRAAGDRE